MLQHHAQLRAEHRATVEKRRELLLAGGYGAVADQEYAKPRRSQRGAEGLGDVSAVAEGLNASEPNPGPRATPQVG